LFEGHNEYLTAGIYGSRRHSHFFRTGSGTWPWCTADRPLGGAADSAPGHRLLEGLASIPYNRDRTIPGTRDNFFKKCITIRKQSDDEKNSEDVLLPLGWTKLNIGFNGLKYCYGGIGNTSCYMDIY